MPAIDRDLTFLNHLARTLDNEEATPAAILDEAYQLIFEEEFGRSRAVTLSDPTSVDERSLNRIIGFMIRIVPRYTQLYQDPHAIPVTHYQRQKKLAVHLDQQLTKMLWEKVLRAQVPGLIENGLPVRDAFLDSPILFMKEDARTKRFPKNKRGGISNVQILVDRFEEKLLAKGINLEATGSDPDRFTYGP